MNEKIVWDDDHKIGLKEMRTQKNEKAEGIYTVLLDEKTANEITASDIHEALPLLMKKIKEN